MKRSWTACLAWLVDRRTWEPSIVTKPSRTNPSISSRQAIRSSKAFCRILRIWETVPVSPAGDIRALNESRRAHAQEHEVFIADIRDPLRHAGGDPNDITCADVGWRQVADFYSPFPADDDVALDDSFEPVPRRRHARKDTRSRDRHSRIGGVVCHLENKAVLMSQEFLR